MIVDRYFDRVAVYWGPPGQFLAVGFHRPLRDYFEALYDAGFLVSRYEEPLPKAEALKRFPRYFRDMLRLPNFLILPATCGSSRTRSNSLLKFVYPIGKHVDFEDIGVELADAR